MTKTYNHANMFLIMPSICEGRLTLETGVSVSTTDQSAKTAVYFTPHIGTNVSLYDGNEWNMFTFGELTLSISGYTADTNYDIFIYDNSGTLTLESTAWTDNTTRATALTTQDGVYVKSGATTRRYLGTIRTTATTGQCEDSTERRFIWSYYNQVNKFAGGSIATGGHTYSTQAWRPVNNNTTVGQGRYEFVLGLKTFCILRHNFHAKFMYGSQEFDQTTSPLQTLSGHNGDPNSNGQLYSHQTTWVEGGFHFAQAMERGVNSSSLGYNSEIVGYHLC